MWANSENALRNVFINFVRERRKYIWSVDFCFLCESAAFFLCSLFRRYFWTMDECSWYDIGAVARYLLPRTQTHTFHRSNGFPHGNEVIFFFPFFCRQVFSLWFGERSKKKREKRKSNTISDHIITHSMRARACVRAPAKRSIYSNIYGLPLAGSPYQANFNFYRIQRQLLLRSHSCMNALTIDVRQYGVKTETITTTTATGIQNGQRSGRNAEKGEEQKKEKMSMKWFDRSPHVT